MQQGRSELVEIPVEVVEMAACDGQDVGHVERAHVGVEVGGPHISASSKDAHVGAGDYGANLRASNERAQVGVSSEGPHTSASSNDTHVSAGDYGANLRASDERVLVGVEVEGPHSGARNNDVHPGAGNHSANHENVHVCASHGNARPTRAKQTIPPALRRRVMRRDGGRCQVPGCRHAVFTDVHHLRPRSEGGANTLENLVTLCSAHHRAIHRGELVVGAPANGLIFRHADGTPYGASSARTSTELRAKAQRALTRLGYGETEALLGQTRVSSSSSGSRFASWHRARYVRWLEREP
jgi:hypothetical protein